jgi:hypothetical protein
MYSNIADVSEPTTGEANFGLDEYEPLFYRPLTGMGQFELLRAPQIRC